MGMTGSNQTRRLSADLRKAGAAAPGLAKLAVRKSCLDLEAIAKDRAPVDTGFLMNSIGTEFFGDAFVVGGRVGPTANYGAFVENGTHRMAPQPYMGPATDAVEPGFLAAMAQIADRTL